MKSSFQLFSNLLVFPLLIYLVIFNYDSKSSLIIASLQPISENYKAKNNISKKITKFTIADNANDISKLFEQAHRAYNAEDYIKAETNYRNILQLNFDPQTNALASNYLGISLFRQGKLNEAIEAYRNSIKTDPNLFSVRVNIGTALYQIGKIKEAQINLDKARELLPKKVDSLKDLDNYRGLYNGLRHINQFHKSIQILRQAININPYLANAASCQLTFEALISMEIPVSLSLTQYKSARCELRFSLPTLSADQTWQKTLAAVHQNILSRVTQQSRYAETYKKVGLEERIIVQPHMLFQPNYPNEKLDQAYSISHLNLGISLLNRAMLTGDSASIVEAITSFKSSLRYNPKYRWTYIYLSIALITQGQLEESISISQQLLKLSNANIDREPVNTHAWAHNLLGYALQLKGDYNSAIAEYQSAIQLDNAFKTAQNNLKEIQ